MLTMDISYSRYFFLRTTYNSCMCQLQPERLISESRVPPRPDNTLPCDAWTSWLCCNNDPAAICILSGIARAVVTFAVALLKTLHGYSSVSCTTNISLVLLSQAHRSDSVLSWPNKLFIFSISINWCLPSSDGDVNSTAAVVITLAQWSIILLWPNLNGHGTTSTFSF